MQSQIDSYHEAAELAGRFEELSADGAAEQPTLSQTLTEADMLAAQELYEEAGNVYARLTRGLQAQLSMTSAGDARAALIEKTVMIKQRQAGVEANREKSRVLAAPLIEADGSAASAATLDLIGTSPGMPLERLRTTTTDFANGAAGSPGTQASVGPPGIHDLLTECAKHNFESQGDEEPVKAKSIWVKYNAGRRRGMWREVWPCNDSATPPWITNAWGPPYFRGMEADDIDIHHGRTTKYLLHLVLEVSETLPPDWDDGGRSPPASTVSSMTDDGDFAGLSYKSAGGMRTPPVSAPQVRPEPEPEREVGLPQTPSQGASPPRSGRQDALTRTISARDVLRQYDLPERVAVMLEEEDIRTPQTLADLDDAMLGELGLKLGEKIKLRQAIAYARSLGGPGAVTPRVPVSPQLKREGSGTRLSDLLADDIDTPTTTPTDVRYQEAYQGFRKASDIANVGEITVEEYLSKGTSGTVCKAQWRGMSVAVKRFYYVDDDKELVSSFENEVFFMRELQHVNLIRFFAAQCKPPDLCIVMELMLGSLSDLLYGKLSKGVEETLTPKRQLSIVKGIASGMYFLHDHGICHRDLKSANVLFNRHLDVKLCDFAFSKFKQQASMSARFETSVGTPAWMAPEVLRGDEYTLLADVYSFGVIVWEIMCREAPFAGLNRFQIIFQVGTQHVLLQLPKGTPSIWVAIANACWREKPPVFKSRRPTFRQIVEVLTTAQQQLKTGVSLNDGCGMAAWDAAEVVRESEYEREMNSFTHSPGIHAGIAEDPHTEAEAVVAEAAAQDSEQATSVAPADPDALRPADIPLARASPRTFSSGALLPPPESPPGDA